MIDPIIIKALKDEQALLNKRIEAIKSALIGFGIEPDLDPSYTTVTSSFVSEPSQTDTHTSKNTLDIPDEYNKYDSWQGKIIYVLSNMPNGGVAEEITNEIHTHEPELTWSKIFGAVTQKASRMYRDREIGAMKVGKKYKYKLL